MKGIENLEDLPLIRGKRITASNPIYGKGNCHKPHRRTLKRSLFSPRSFHGTPNTRIFLYQTLGSMLIEGPCPHHKHTTNKNYTHHCNTMIPHPPTHNGTTILSVNNILCSVSCYIPLRQLTHLLHPPS